MWLSWKSALAFRGCGRRIIHPEGPRGEGIMQIILDEYENRVLRESIEDTLSNMREEVYKTESFDYREQLKRRKAALEAVRERLMQAAEPVAR